MAGNVIKYHTGQECPQKPGGAVRVVFCLMHAASSAAAGIKKHEEPLREGCSGRTQLHWKGFSDIKYYYREI